MINKCVLILVYCLGFIIYQHREDMSKIDTNILVESTYSNFEIVGQSKHLYLRIYKTGIVEYEVETETDAGYAYHLVKKQISLNDLQTLEELVNSNELSEFGNNVLITNNGIDYSFTLSIIFNNNSNQPILKKKLKPIMDSNSKEKMTLLKLCCLFDNIRKGSNYTFISSKFCK